MAKAQLTVLSPVHIGNGTTYNKDIHFLTEANKIGIIDPEKIAALINLDEALIESWVKSIESEESLVKFLNKNRGVSFTLEQISSRIINSKGVAQIPAQLKEHYSSPLQGLVIPGSSLKGSIRTSVLEHLTNDYYMNNLRGQSIMNFRGQFSDNTVLSQIFGRDAKEQSTRFLKVGDVHFTHPISEAREAVILSLTREGFRKKPGSHLFEVIAPNTTSTAFNLKIDEDLLKHNVGKYAEKWSPTKINYLKNGIEGILKLVDDFTRETIGWDIDLLMDEHFDKTELGAGYLDFCNELLNSSTKMGECILRIGAHSGWLYTTGGWIRKDTPLIPDNVKSQIRRVVQKNRHYPFDLWPKTRKVSTLGEPFGFVKIKLL